MMPLTPSVGERLSARRKYLGYSIREIARAAGVSYMTVYRVERDQVEVNLPLAVRLARLLGLTLEYLADGIPGVESALPRRPTGWGRPLLNGQQGAKKR